MDENNASPYGPSIPDRPMDAEEIEEVEEVAPLRWQPNKVSGDGRTTGLPDRPSNVAPRHNPTQGLIQLSVHVSLT